jgi:hypothetical protein
LEYVQVVPATHVPLPVQPSPAHWLHSGKDPPAAAEDVAAAELDVLLEEEIPEVDSFVAEALELLEVESVVAGALVVALLEDTDEELTTAPPGPATEVVREPLST